VNVFLMRHVLHTDFEVVHATFGKILGLILAP